MQKVKKTAFSLIELSVVILIISILAAGTISMSTVAITNAKNKVTRERLDAIYKAMGTFLAKNYHLPCPASLKLTKASSTYGETLDSNDCSSGDGVYSSVTDSMIVYGAVPVAALNLPDEMAEDGFGTKISYIMHSGFALQNYPTVLDETIGFSYYNIDSSATDLIKVYQLPSTNRIDNVAFVLLSHGANKYGGFNANSSSQNSTAGANTHEIYNALSSITDNGSPTIDTAAYGVNPSFVGDVTFTATNSSSDVFDDIILFKTRDDIIRELNLGFLAACTQDTPNAVDDFPNAYAGQISYRTTACPSPNADITPSMLCGAYAGTWVAIETCP
jgi:prepilin-type N-terminal cleavage/methylation domain-containing protein